MFKISLLNKNRKLGLNFELPSDLESAEERKKRKQRLRSKIIYQLKTINIPENEIPKGVGIEYIDINRIWFSIKILHKYQSKNQTKKHTNK